MSEKSIYVSAALIVENHRVLACQRGYGTYKGWWEFPGGKVEALENSKEAVVRECAEELNIHVQPQRLLERVEYDYPEFHLVMDCWLCLLPKEHLELKEHMNARWLDGQSLYSVQWLPADLGVLKKLEHLL